jgi:1-acyl-sn-glycerol-3-phosphate acyltransferase
MKYLRAAFRFVLFIGSTLGLYSIWFMGAGFIPNKQMWRQWALGSWARAFVKISGMRVEVVGVPPRPPFFLVSNHLSYTDVAAIRSVLEGVFVAKGEMEGWFVAGRIVTDMGTIFINRQNRRDIPRAGAKIIERLESGEGVIVFPEGTSTKGEMVLPFNSSFLEFAAQRDLPVSYASITYKTPNDSPKAMDTICWWDEKTFGEHLWELFQVKKFTAVISFGNEPVHNPNRKELAKTLWNKVNDNFVPVV